MQYTSTSTKTVEAIQYTGDNDDEVIAWLNAHDKKKRTWRVRDKWDGRYRGYPILTEFVAKAASPKVTHLVQKFIYEKEFFVSHEKVIRCMTSEIFRFNYPNAVEIKE